VRVLALLAAAVPFVFGLIRLAQTGSDARYLVVAAAALCGAAAVMTFTRTGTAASSARLGTVARVFVGATVLAVAAALFLGTRLGPGMLIVGAAFGFCFAVASALHMRARG
jgi:hypothetical protein